MPLNSVQQFIANQINGLEVPIGGTRPLEAYITPPTVEDLDRPKAYVWGGRCRGRRQTAPRTTSGIGTGKSGFKHLDWTVDIYLAYETTPDSVTADQEFPAIVDAVLAKLWTVPMPTFITDPLTGLVSQIQAVGEEWDLEMLPERTPNTLRMLYYSARIGMNVYEVVQA